MYTFSRADSANNFELDAVCQNDWRETIGKVCINFAQLQARRKAIKTGRAN